MLAEMIKWLVIITCCALVAFAGALRCNALKGHRYVEGPNGNGRCVQCPDCGPGKERNRTAKVPSSRYGDLMCLPCVPCGEGRYREQHSTSRRCFKCILNCTLLNRIEGQPCGGTTKGNCNSCLPGYKKTSSDIWAPCYAVDHVEDGPHHTETVHRVTDSPPTTSGLSPRATAIPGVIQHLPGNYQSSGTNVIDNGDGKVDSTQTGPDIGVYLAITIGMSIVIVIGYKMLKRCSPKGPPVYSWYNGRRHSPGMASQSCLVSRSTLGVSGSHDNLEVWNASKVQVDVEEGLLDPVEKHKDDVKPVMQMADQDEELEVDGRELLKPARHDNPLARIPLDVNHTALTFVATNTYPEEVYAMFRYLGLNKADYEPQRELFLYKKQEYADVVLNMLIRWIQRAGPGATLDVLVEALEHADFPAVADKLRETYGS